MIFTSSTFHDSSLSSFRAFSLYRLWGVQAEQSLTASERVSERARSDGLQLAKEHSGMHHR